MFNVGVSTTDAMLVRCNDMAHRIDEAFPAKNGPPTMQWPMKFEQCFLLDDQIRIKPLISRVVNSQKPSHQFRNGAYALGRGTTKAGFKKNKITEV